MTSNLEKIWSTDINLIDNQLLNNGIDINNFQNPIDKYMNISQLNSKILTPEELSIINNDQFYNIIESQSNNLTPFQKFLQTVKQINQNIWEEKFKKPIRYHSKPYNSPINHDFNSQKYYRSNSPIDQISNPPKSYHSNSPINQISNRSNSSIDPASKSYHSNSSITHGSNRSNSSINPASDLSKPYNFNSQTSNPAISYRSNGLLSSEIINQGFVNLSSISSEIYLESKYEFEFLETYSPCDLDKISLISLNLPSLDIKKLKDLIDVNFYDYNIMSTTSCIIRAFTNSPENIHQLITNVHQIGTPSVYGIALDADLNNAENFFIFKFPKNGNLNHECFVAFKATNYLRKFCPNFMYIFDTIDCSIPVIGPDGKVINWCNKSENPNNNKMYAILENCLPNISFSEFCKQCSLKDFIRYYFQIVLAIREGYLKYKFTHYDMHTGNILLRKVSSNKFYIPYETLQGTIFLESLEYISTIIDYGFSHIEITVPESYPLENNSRQFGFDLKLPKGVYREALPITDVYKLLCTSLFIMKNNNNNTFENAKYLLNFFIGSSTDYNEFLNQQSLNNFYLPLIPKVTQINYDSYVDYCLEFIEKMKISDIVQKTEPNGKILKCGYSEDKMMTSNIIKKCNTSNYYLNAVGLPLSGTNSFEVNIITFLDFYNLHKQLSEEHIINTVKVKQVQDNFLKNYSDAFTKERIEIKKIIDQINLNNSKIYYFPNDSKKILNPEVLKLTGIYTTKNILFLQLYKDLTERLKIGRYIQKVYQLKSPNKFIDYYNSIEDYLIKNQTYKNTVIKHYYENVKFLKINQNMYPTVKDSPYKYYWEDYMELGKII